MKKLPYLLLSFMYAWQYNMAGRFIIYLLNIFAQVGVDHFNAAFAKVFVQMAFFGKHGFAFYHLRNILFLQYRVNDLVMLFGVGRPVNIYTVFFKVGFKLQ